MRRLGARRGWRLVAEALWPLEIDFDEWLQRGSTGRRNQSTIEAALASIAQMPAVFRVSRRPIPPLLHLQYGFFLWQTA